MNATEVLDAIKRKYPQAALVRELTVTDEYELALYRRWYIDSKPQSLGETMTAHWESRGMPIAPPGSVPEGYVPHSTPTTRRIDGLLLDSQKFTAIEVKVSRADFLRETEAKRRAWRAITSRFVYATPAGLLKPDEIPTGCGLWEVDDQGYVMATKRAAVKKDPDPLPGRTWRAVFYRLSAAERKAAA